MLPNILLISMPFASVQFASMGLSTLKPVLELHEMACDIVYLNFAFRKFVNDAEAYDRVTDHWMLGEWVFGGELFGEDWVDSRAGSIERVSEIIASQSAQKNHSQILGAAGRYRRAAGAFLDRCITDINWEKYQIVGFTSAYSQQTASLALAQRVKKCFPEKVIVFGGANCQDEMGLAIMEHFSFVDWVFSGDAEESFPRAVKCWSAGRAPEGIEGVVIRKDGRIIHHGTTLVMDLNQLPYPDFKDYFQAVKELAPDLYGRVPLSVELSRGCWWSAKSQCTFCGIHSQLHTYRCKSPERALSEINDLTSFYGVGNVWVIDTNLASGYYRTLLPALGMRKNVLSGFFVETKADIKRENLGALKQAGARVFQPGIESLDTEVLNHMRKGTTLLQNVRVLKWARDLGLKPMWNFLHSFPGESSAAYLRMADLIPYLVHLHPPTNVGPMALQRFSPLFQHPEQWNIMKIRASEGYRSMYPFDPEQLDRIAYTFDYAVEGSSSEKDYLNPVLNQLEIWKDLWCGKEPPLLAYEPLSCGNLLVYDTRPVGKELCVELETHLSLALQACDTGLTLKEISKEVKEEMGSAAYPGDIVLQKGMERLAAFGFVIKEGACYLNLVHDLKHLKQRSGSLLAYLLGH